MVEGQLRAVIYVPDGDDAGRWRRASLEHCQRQGYALVAVAAGDAGRYDDAVAMLMNGEAQVLVVARREHVPDDRVPRVEVAPEVPLPRQRRGSRPEVFRRGQGGHGGA